MNLTGREQFRRSGRARHGARADFAVRSLTKSTGAVHNRRRNIMEIEYTFRIETVEKTEKFTTTTAMSKDGYSQAWNAALEHVRSEGMLPRLLSIKTTKIVEKEENKKVAKAERKPRAKTVTGGTKAGIVTPVLPKQ